ncbi:MAG: insulinase family protein [Chloroflexi bacterium]|nr:insulinase family protein [Chloroflexota bacterium]
MNWALFTAVWAAGTTRNNEVIVSQNPTTAVSPVAVTTPVTVTKLPNGLTVIIKPTHVAPVATFWVFYQVGSRNEFTGHTGISHWVEHMMFKGTPLFGKGELDRLVARQGGVFNAFTSQDLTTYFTTLPADRIDLALRVEADRMVHALFDTAEVESERTVIISEREGNENYPQFQLSEELLALAFKVHTYHHQVIGWKSDLESMTREDLYQHYRTYYTPRNAVAVLVGDVDGSVTLARIEELYGAIPAGPDVPAVHSTEPPQVGRRQVYLEGPGGADYLEMAFHVPQASHPDYFPLVVLDTVLNGAQPMSFFSGGGPSNRSARLYRALVETELAAEVDTSMEATTDPFLYSFTVTAREERSLDEVEAALWVEIERIQQEPITSQELARAIRQSQAEFAYATESVSDQAFWLGYSQVVLGDHRWMEGFLEKLAQVTQADVQRVAQTYLTRRNCTVGCYTATDKAAIDQAEEDEEEHE